MWQFLSCGWSWTGHFNWREKPLTFTWVFCLWLFYLREISLQDVKFRRHNLFIYLFIYLLYRHVIWVVTVNAKRCAHISFLLFQGDKSVKEPRIHLLFSLSPCMWIHLRVTIVPKRKLLSYSVSTPVLLVVLNLFLCPHHAQGESFEIKKNKESFRRGFGIYFRRISEILEK